MKFRNFHFSSDTSHVSFTSSWVEKLSIYQIAMDHEQSIRTGYQILLSTIEIALLSFVFTLNQFGVTSDLWVFILMGIFLCFPFGVACEFRARNVDFWRILIVYIIMDTDIEAAFKHAKYQWIPYGKAGFWGGYLFGHWFERILITLMLLVWMYISWYLPISNILRGIGILGFFGWIIYAFQIIEPTGEIMLPEQ